MKDILTILLVFTFITIGCDTTTKSNDNDEIQSHSTINIKNGTEYFNFATNSGSTDETSAYDVVFYSELFQPQGMPFPISDPRFQVKEGRSIAVVNAEDLEDVTEVPASGTFVTGFTSEFGEWYNTSESNLVIPQDKVYVVNTTDGNFPAFEITNYYDEDGESGVFTIEWKYLSE